MSGMSSLGSFASRACRADAVPATSRPIAHGALFAVDGRTRASDPEDHVLDMEGNRAILALLPHHVLAAWGCRRASCCRHPARCKRRRWLPLDAGRRSKPASATACLVAASRSPRHAQEEGELAVRNVQVQALHELVVVDMADPDVNVPCVVQAPLQRSPSPNPRHLRIARAFVLGEGPEPVPLALQVVCGLGATRQRSDAGHRTQEARLGDTMTERNSTPR